MFKFFIKFFLLLFILSKAIFAEEKLFLEDNFYPEGITVTKNGDLFVGSLKENKIVKLKNKKKKI